MPTATRSLASSPIATVLTLLALAATACSAADDGADGTSESLQNETASVASGCADGVFYWDLPDCEPAALIDVAEIRSGGPPPDGIPPIDEPRFESVTQAGDWLAPNSPLLVISINGEVRGYPLAIMTYHEIVNDEVGGVPIAVTYCPLCNSGLVFQRTVGAEILDFGTSGRLYRSNLVMYDRAHRNLWNQFNGTAVVGSHFLGTQLERVPSSLLGFGELVELEPDAQILSRDTGHDRNYGTNPYVGYDREDARPFLYQGPEDERLDLMTRIVGLGADKDPIAIPLGTLTRAGVVTVEVAGQQVTVLWAPGAASALDARTIDESADVGQTAAFAMDGTTTLIAAGDGVFTDTETSSSWDLLGRAIAGPRAGEQLTAVPLDDTFWFVWFAFVPETRLLP